VEVSAGSVSWPVELTVVDNASTDEVSKEAFKLLSAAGYQVILEKRTGPSAARNKGLKLSRAKAVVPLDADNRILPALLLGAEGILDGTADIAYGPWRRFGLDSRIVYPPENIDWTALMPHNTIDNCAIVSRKLLDSLGGWKENIFGYEDWDLWLRALRKKARFLNLKEVTFEYLVRPGSMTSGFQADPDSLQTAYLRVFNKHKRRLQMKKLWSRLSS
jgi:glycosyltransferase involved in cell wall biosynthesis